MTALTNAVWEVPNVNKTPPEKLEYRPDYLGDITKKSQTSRTLNSLQYFISPGKFSESPDSGQNLQIRRKNFAFLPKQAFLELTPPDLIYNFIDLQFTQEKHLLKFIIYKYSRIPVVRTLDSLNPPIILRPPPIARGKSRLLWICIIQWSTATPPPDSRTPHFSKQNFLSLGDSKFHNTSWNIRTYLSHPNTKSHHLISFVLQNNEWNCDRYHYTMI